MPKTKTREKELVPVKELPEVRDARAWATNVRERAEREINNETVQLPEGVLARIENAVGQNITRRQADIATMWNGIGVRGTAPGSGDYYSIKATLKEMAKLPSLGADAGVWWALNATSMSAESIRDKIALHSLLPRHYIATSESGTGMKETLRGLLKGMMPAIPDASATYRILVDYAARQPRLSDVVKTLNSLEMMREVITESDSDVSHEVETVMLALLEDELVPEVDCGKVVSADQMRNTIEKYGQGVRGCRKCDNWFVVAEENIPYHWYDSCPACSKHWVPGVSMGGGKAAPEERLTTGIDKWTRNSTNIGLKVALAEGTTLYHAKLLLLGESKQTPAQHVADIKECPVAADCATLCGELQREGRRTIPLTPDSGRFEDCYLHSFFNMAKGVSREDRDLIAQQWIDSINEKTRREREEAVQGDERNATGAAESNAASANGSKPHRGGKKAPKVATRKGADAEITMQAALF